MSAKKVVSERLDGVVQSVDRALRIVEALAADGNGCGLSDLAMRTDLSPSTAHRLLTTLERRRFVQFDRNSRAWRIGVMSHRVGLSFMGQEDLTDHALPYLRRLRDQAHETANLAMVSDGNLIILSRVQGQGPTRSLSVVGGRVSMATSALGKALLAAYSEKDALAVVQREGLPRLTSRSIVQWDDLWKSLKSIRQRGYSVDDEEAQAGVRCVSAVVYDREGDPHAAISLSGGTLRVSDERLPVLGKAVQAAARELTIAIGGTSRGDIL